jgi:type IV pilus assembly protein PilO
MANNLALKIDFADIQAKAQAQFTGLNPNDPASWPSLPKYALYFVLAALVVGVLWVVALSGFKEELETETAKEVALKEDYKKKLVQAINLEALKKQREQVQQYVTQLEKQLPSKAEMDALLSDINQAGLGRGLQFLNFKPFPVVVKDYYAELPISLRVGGRYHDLGAFASDLAQLSRIVTLGNITVNGSSMTVSGSNLKDGKDSKDAMLEMNALVKTYRYLDPDEVEAQKKATQGKKK